MYQIFVFSILRVQENMSTKVACHCYIFLTALFLISEPIEALVQCYECMTFGVSNADLNCATGRCIGQYCYKAINQGLVRRGCEMFQGNAGCQ